MKTLQLLIDEIKLAVKPYYIREDGTAYDDLHDWAHMTRVYGACCKMLALEPSANRGEVLIAALLHDIGRQNIKEPHAEESYIFSEQVLASFVSDFEDLKIDLEKVRLMVKYHSVAHICPDYEISDSIEFNIFTDADKMDMFGAWGILRISLTFASKGRPALYATIAELKKMANPDRFQFQSKPGQIVGQKYKAELKHFIDSLEAQSKDFELE